LQVSDSCWSGWSSSSVSLSVSVAATRDSPPVSLISQSYMEMDQCLFYLEGDPLDIHVPNIQYLMSIHFPNIWYNSNRGK
jgi:hypothetical protein